MVPMNGEPGMRTPGRPADVAQPSAMSQFTLYGSGKSSRRNPNPGTCTVYPYWSGSISTISTSSRSPGSAPSTYTGPVSGCTTSRSGAATVSSEASGLICPSKASRVSRMTSSPGSQRTSGGMSGCQRLWPVPGSSASVLLRSMRISWIAISPPRRPASAAAITPPVPRSPAARAREPEVNRALVSRRPCRFRSGRSPGTGTCWCRCSPPRHRPRRSSRLRRARGGAGFLWGSSPEREVVGILWGAPSECGRPGQPGLALIVMPIAMARDDAR